MPNFGLFILAIVFFIFSPAKGMCFHPLLLIAFSDSNDIHEFFKP
jgi:hypothetical protein